MSEGGPGPTLSLRAVVRTGGALTSLGPYVPCAGVGGRALYTVATPEGTAVWESGPAGTAVRYADRRMHVESHPVYTDTGLCFYGRWREGPCRVWIVENGEPACPAPDLDAGPAGPYAAVGDLAWRGKDPRGVEVAGSRAGLRLRSDEAGAADGARVVGFEGLPLVDGRGRLHVRANTARGDALLSTGAPGGPRLPPGEPVALGRFPALDVDGAVIVVAAGPPPPSGRGPLPSPRASGSPQPDLAAVLRVDARVERLDAGGVAWRGALALDARRWVGFGAPAGGSFGLYPGAAQEPDLAFGAPWHGARVAEFALNPVSLAPDGTLAVRVGFVDGSGVIAVGQLA